MRRDEVHAIFERVDKQLREADDHRLQDTAAAKRLMRERKSVLAKLAPLKKANEALEERARRMGLSFRTFYGEPERLEVNDSRGAASPARRRFSQLKDQWRIATLGTSAEDVKQQQAVLREVAKLAEAHR